MRKFAFIVVVAALVYGYLQERGLSIPGLTSLIGSSSDSTLQAAYRNRESGIQVQATGTVTRLLPDDLDGSRHQKFILELGTDQTLLVTHNIDLAPRISRLRTGDTVEFLGQYEWNTEGGVIHWTHHDPAHSHPGGWLKHKGKTYQ